MMINVRVTPGARKEGVKGGDPVIVKVAVRSERGKATKRALELLSKHFGKRATLVAGMTSRDKVVEISD